MYIFGLNLDLFLTSRKFGFKAIFFSIWCTGRACICSARTQSTTHTTTQCSRAPDTPTHSPQPTPRWAAAPSQRPHLHHYATQNVILAHRRNAKPPHLTNLSHKTQIPWLFGDRRFWDRLTMQRHAMHAHKASCACRRRELPFRRLPLPPPREKGSLRPA